MSSPVTRDNVSIFHGDALNFYDEWPSPVVIISDGAYGLSHWSGDPSRVDELYEWYEQHIKKWSEKATPLTTLWFWNREIGWANIHPLFSKYGWKFVNCHIWDKGIEHVAGNSNTQSLRQFPIVTEICVQYVKKAEFKTRGKKLEMQEWLRYEWERTGLPLYKANEACNVKNAATRKYLTKDNLFYFPPPDRFEEIVRYANRYGSSKGRPYFSIDGRSPLTKEAWSKMRSKFKCEVGVTNVWRVPPLQNSERFKIKNGGKALHPNQKPLELIELAIKSSSDEEDVVWEPFGGLCTVAIASYKLNRRCYSAEINKKLFEIAVDRLTTYNGQRTGGKRTRRLDAFFPMETVEKNINSSTISF